MVSPSNELVLVISMGKKTKEFAIALEKADISNEESLAKKVACLEKQLERKTFEAAFFKDQYELLLRNLQLKPKIEELEKLYARGNLIELFEGEKEEMNESKLTKASSLLSSKSVKVEGSILKEDHKCPRGHVMEESIAHHPRFRCNICRSMIPLNGKKLTCKPCDFDVCSNCLNVYFVPYPVRPSIENIVPNSTPWPLECPRTTK
jgi:hypothetical protein